MALALQKKLRSPYIVEPLPYKLYIGKQQQQVQQVIRVSCPNFGHPAQTSDIYKILIVAPKK